MCGVNMTSLAVDDVLRYVFGSFLPDKDRLAVAQVCHSWHALARLDACPVIFDKILNVQDQTGFCRTRNGYWELVDRVSPCFRHPSELGMLAANDPWTFVRTWLSMMPSSSSWSSSTGIKSRDFRRQCVQSLCLQVWGPDVLVSIKVMLSCCHDECGLLCRRLLKSGSHQLFRRAVWYGKKDIVIYMLDEGGVDADADSGTPLRLALSTLGYENSEDEVADVVHELLLRGANPARHGLWGIRLCLHLRFYVIGSLMCTYAMKWSYGRNMLELFLEELRENGHMHQASLVHASMQNFMFL